ncbi:MAG: MFS transporter [Anaerolineales bacterium]|nr:MFS transporter [Anaerolineales bacterium]
MKKLRWFDYITINIYWLGLSMASGSLTPIILPYLVGLFVPEEVKGTALGTLRSAGLAIAILVQPAAGLLSDRSMLRWGRRRPYIFLGTVLNLVFLTLMGLAGNYWFLFASVLLLQFSSNIGHGALQGLIPDLVPEEQRGRASGVKAIMELAPIIITAFTTARLIGAGEVWAALLLVMAFFLVTMLITVFFVHEEPLIEEVKEPLSPQLVRIALLTIIFVVVTTVAGGAVGLVGRLSRGMGVAQLVAVGLAGLAAMAGAIILGVWWSARVGIGEGARQYPSFTWWVVNRLLWLAAAGSIQGFALYFLQDVLLVPNAPVAVGNLMMVVGIFTLLAALPSGWLADRFGRKPLVALAGVVGALGTFLLFISHDMAMVTVCGTIIGLSAGVFMTTNWALGTDLVPPAEAGRYLGVSNLAGAGAGIVGAGIGGPMADFFNAYQKGLGYLVIFAIYGVLFLLSAVTLLKVRPTRGEEGA